MVQYCDKNTENSNVEYKMDWTIPIIQFFIYYNSTLTRLGHYNIWNSSSDHQIYYNNTDLKQLELILEELKTNDLPSQQAMHHNLKCIMHRVTASEWLQWHHVLGSSRSGIPWNKHLVSSWSRIPQDVFETRALICHPHLQQC